MNSQPHEQQEHVQKEANPPEIAQLEETLTTVRLRISSMTRGQKDWRLCWASLLPAVPKLPSVDMLETGRKKKGERVSAEGRMRESKARRFPPNPRNTGRGQPGSAPGKLAKICQCRSRQQRERYSQPPQVFGFNFIWFFQKEHIKKEKELKAADSFFQLCLFARSYRPRPCPATARTAGLTCPTVSSSTAWGHGTKHPSK